MNKKQILFGLICIVMQIPSLVRAQHDHFHEGHIHSKGYAAMNSSDKLVPFEFERKAIKDNEILIDIMYSGICHSDIHQLKNDWNSSIYPMVAGHEIVGKVTQVGKDVTKFKVGDYAGVGCMVGSCGVCDNCKSGLEQYCENKVIFTYNDVDADGDNLYGGYSNNIVVNEHFGINIPKDANLEKVAPLLCAGITTYSALRQMDIKPGDKVAIAGFGGLGHMAVQYAKSLGANVTVFDITEEKRDFAKELGAEKYINVNNVEQMKDLNNSFDYILSTIPVDYSIPQYLNILKLHGEMGIVGAPSIAESPKINLFEIPPTKKLWVSMIGGIPETQEAVNYSIAHNIYPIVESISIQQINEALKNVANGEVYFRYVIDMSSLD